MTTMQEKLAAKIKALQAKQTRDLAKANARMLLDDARKALTAGDHVAWINAIGKLGELTPALFADLESE